MGRVYLCLGKNAEVPYYFERARAHVWNVEELCYFLRENVWLLEPALFSRELCSWVGEQCGLKELSLKLYTAVEKEGTAEAFLKVLFSYTGYCSAQDLERMEKVLKVSASASDLERQKARGDYFLENGRYVLAMREYEELLARAGAAEPSLRGRVLHNLGVAQARMFWFEKAAISLEQAWKLTGRAETACQYLAAKRFLSSPQEYVAFLAERPDLYQASLQLEKQVEQCETAWADSEDARLCSHAQEARRDGAAHICEEMVEKRVKPLQEEYRNRAVC